MANRPKGYGLTAEIKNKIASKYDLHQEQEARIWIEAVLEEPLVEGADPDEPLGPEQFQVALKDGIILCRLADAVMGPGKVKYNKMKIAFKQMENISNFLGACEAYGVAKTDLFQTVDLYENQNMVQVVSTIHALGRKAQSHGYTGPVLGPREAQRNVRHFDDDVLNQGKTVIGLQMGTNKLASQKGMSFGATRHINDLKVAEGTKEGQAIIGLQMGTNQGASQAGMNIGKSRSILD